MELPTDLRSISMDHRYGGTADRAASPCIRPDTKLCDMLMSEKPNLSYAHFHHEITRHADDAVPKHFRSQLSKLSDKTSLKEDEVVRYMSDLPSYLEKGKNDQEKALSVGVIDWKRLEKWQYIQKHMPYKYNGYSPSSSNTSLSSTTDGSLTHSRTSRGQSYSTACQRMPTFPQKSLLEGSPQEKHVQHVKSSAIRGPSCSPARQITDRPELQSHTQKVYAREGESQDTDIFRGNARAFQEYTSSTGSNLSRQPKAFATFQGCERKRSELKSVSAVVHRPTSDTYKVAIPCKGKTKIQGNKSSIETSMLQEANAAYQGYAARDKSGILIKLKDQSESSCSGATISDSTVNGWSPGQRGWKLFSGKTNGEDPSFSEDHSNKHLEPTGSYSWNSEAVKNSSQTSSLHRTKMLNNSLIGTPGVKAPFQASYLLPFPVRRFSSPSRSRNTEEKKPIAGLSVASAAKSSDELDVRKSSESIPKARNPSPIRRLSFAMSKMIKNAGSRENSPLRRSSSTEAVAKSGSEGARASVSADNPSSERSSSNSKGRSSPLRRLLDPLLKSRASSSPEPSKKHSSSTVISMKLSHEPSDSGPRPSVKTKPRCASRSTKGFCDPHVNSKTESSIQALLQVSFKNGLPLFTFAIDNESTILAATVRKSYVPGKGHYTWAYTFFTIREIKRKSGIWLNQGGKGNGHGYAPNVVAQMKVSDSLGSHVINLENADMNITREFDLFAVNVGHGDQHGTDFHPTNELAAIVVKLPRVTNGNASKDGQSAYSWLDSSEPLLRETLQGRVSSANSDDNLQTRRDMQTPSFSTTVILPGGVHTIPSRGEISTLAQRWKSGGSCDCGGWDLGCQLRVYTSRSEYERKMGSSATSLEEFNFQLFSQVGQDNQLMLSLAPFKERIYSVEFNSSLSLLQAFAVCISFIDCRRPAELPGPTIAVEKISDEVSVFEVPVQMKTSSHQVEVPARYISYPPDSPVGRV